MKRIISFIIAISILFSIFAVPATAVTKSWYHALESVNGAIEGTCNATTSVETIDVLDFKGIVGCIFSFDGWLLPDEGQIIEKFVVSKDGGYTWEDTDYTTRDRSSEGKGLVGYSVYLSTEGKSTGDYSDVIAVVVDGAIYEIINFSYSLVEQGTITNANQIIPGETKLEQDISGQLSVSKGIYVIDLAGYTWSHSSTALSVNGTANVTVIDSVGGGKIYANNDAITPDGGTLTLRGISVEADSSGCDALFVTGGTVVIEDCFLDARQSSVHNDNRNGATVSVIGCTLDGDDVALKGRNNAVITISGNTVFNNTAVEMQRGFDSSRLVTDTFVAGEGCTITFDNPAAAGNGIRVNVTSYTGPVVVEDPAFAGATVEVDAGISLDFLVSDATEATEVKYNGVALPSAEYSEGVTKYTLSGFGPQEMGDDFTVELFVDGKSVDTLTYSVKKYCDTVLADDSASAELKTLVKEMLNYGAMAQIYRNYKKDAPVNTGIEPTGSKYNAPENLALLKQAIFYTPVKWKYATVNFADKIQLIFAFEGTVDKVNVFVGDDKTYESTNFGTDADGVSYVVFEDFTPADFRQKVVVQALNNGTIVSRNLEYSVGSYILFAAQSNDTALADLARALMIYGDAVATYIASL